MTQIPRDSSPESTLALLRDGYDFITNRCRHYDTDIFQTRLLMQNTICITGEEAARLFYDQTRFIRQGAMPLPLQKTLTGQDSVQGLDGEAHRVRKALFLSLMTESSINDIVRRHDAYWDEFIRRWAAQGRIVLFDEMQEMLCRTVCAWSGVPLQESEVTSRTRQLAAMINGTGGVGLRHLRARRARAHSEAWATALVDQVRRGQLKPPATSALHAVSWHRDEHEQLLPPHIAAVELLNVLRPVVAIAYFVVFIALSLHRYPQWRQTLQTDDTLVEPFVQEVRRLYAFFPFVAARVKQDFEWRGYTFPAGTRVLLDLYGTCRDTRTWEAPEEFRPERFRHWDSSLFDLIPQGGGDLPHHHRCPGEGLAIALMKLATRKLTRAMSYDIPEQDLTVDLSRIPLIPKSRMILDHVRLR